MTHHAAGPFDVTVKIRYGDFETITRAATLDEPTDLTDALRAAASALFDRWAEALRVSQTVVQSFLDRYTQGEGR